ncbi:MAG TPA: thioredoxin [Caldisericia bacterium]|jgi:thioredoxin 1|nr:thioredoxin [Caldisericia bacterium]HXK51327.1 thioredoxin [Caldisericia bacterium]
MSNYIEIKSMDEFETQVLKADKPVLVDFWAPWCGPCRMVAPALEELANESNGKFLVAKVNTDDAAEVAMKYSIVSIPTLILFKNGTAVDKVIGALPKEQLKAFIDKNA